MIIMSSKGNNILFIIFDVNIIWLYTIYFDYFLNMLVIQINF